MAIRAVNPNLIFIFIHPRSLTHCHLSNQKVLPRLFFLSSSHPSPIHLYQNNFSSITSINKPTSTHLSKTPALNPTHMDLFSPCSSSFILSLIFLLIDRGVSGVTFTFVNNCAYTVWPGILANAGTPKLESTGFELPRGTSRSFQPPTGWSGRFWGRTGCSFDGSGQGSCKTGDCGSGQIECNGAGAAPPATLAEITLGSGAQDFYDVSLVDGYNLPMVMEGSGGSGTCVSTGCVTDLNRQCPTELRFGDGDACKSACEAFGTPEYCCSGAYNTPNTCKPSVYSQMFKSACPRSYSYAYDDATSTFTCTGADYTVTFCPSYSNSQKSSTADSTPRATETTDASGSGTGSGSVSVPGSGSGAGSGSEGAMLADGSWLEGLASGDATRTRTPTFQTTFTVSLITTVIVVVSRLLY